MKLLHQLTPAQMQEADKLEVRYYGEDHMAGWETAMAWQEAYPWMSCFAEEDGKIVACVDLMPVHWDYYDKLMTGERDTDHLSVSDMVDLERDEPGAYPLVLLTVIVAEEARGKGLLHRMLSDRISYYAGLEEKGLTFPVIGTENFTADGCRFSKNQGWDLIKEKGPAHRIYQVDWATFLKIWN